MDETAGGANPTTQSSVKVQAGGTNTLYLHALEETKAALGICPLRIEQLCLKIH